MKVVLNNNVDFAEVEMDCIPRVGESLSYNDVYYVVYEVEWVVGETNHVNLMLQET